MVEVASVATVSEIRQAVREVLREELQALIPKARASLKKDRTRLRAGLLTVRETATLYRRGYYTILRMAKKGELLSVTRPNGDGTHTLIVAADAAQKLGGAA